MAAFITFIFFALVARLLARILGLDKPEGPFPRYIESGKRNIKGYFGKHGHTEFRQKFQTVLHHEFDVMPEILENHVQFYKRLTDVEKLQFQKDVIWFLDHIRVVGVGIEVNDLDRHLVAASGVIPIFYFPNWYHYELDEVLLFQNAININFETEAHDSNILGMVGTGRMERKMALSRHALHDGFSNKTDKHNTALHEFLHLVDKADGRIDGLPKVLMDQPYAIPWLQMIREKISHIKSGQSDIDEYGATNLSEFFAVAGEYFFERPELLKIKHPELYKFLDDMFRGKITS